MKKKKRLLLSLIVVFLCLFTGCAASGSGREDSSRSIPSSEKSAGLEGAGQDEQKPNVSESGKKLELQEDATYISKDEVAAYLNEFGRLPDNYITKKEARELGWVSRDGNLAEVAPGKSIGGDHFGNYEDKLPAKKGREYYECDIDSDGGYRGAKRIIYSNDGLIYYTQDHYNSFELLYREE